MPAAAVIPEALRDAALTPRAARREVLARFVALAGPVSSTTCAPATTSPRAGSSGGWTSGSATGVLVRGALRRRSRDTRWCSRRVLEQARRRELAQARKQIEAVPLPDFARFLQRWQHLAPGDAPRGRDGAATRAAQLYGLARPRRRRGSATTCRRASRLRAGVVGALAGGGRLVWAAEPRRPRAAHATHCAVPVMGRVRFFERGTGRLWLAPPIADDGAQRRRAARCATRCARTARRSPPTSPPPPASAHSALRDALRELVAAGACDQRHGRGAARRAALAPGVSREARQRARPHALAPGGFHAVARSADRAAPVNLRRLARWQRPDRPRARAGAAAGRSCITWARWRADR